MPSKSKKKEIDVEIPKDLMPTYSNLVNINATKNEIFFDFINVAPGTSKVLSRVILSKEHVKNFSKVLNDFVKKIK